MAAELARIAEVTRLAALQQASMTPQALQMSRHARRVYVGSLPPNITETSISHFFNQVGCGVCVCVCVHVCVCMCMNMSMCMCAHGVSKTCQQNVSGWSLCCCGCTAHVCAVLGCLARRPWR